MRLKILSISKKYYINQYVMDFLDIMILLKTHPMSNLFDFLKTLSLIFWFFLNTWIISIQVRMLYVFLHLISPVKPSLQPKGGSESDRFRWWNEMWACSILSHERLEHMHIQGFIEMELLSGFKYRQSTVPDFPSFPLQREQVEIEKG